VFEIFAFHEYQFDVIPWSTIRTVVDCGAHVGGFAIWMSNRSECQVLAIEPNPSTFPLLAENLTPLGDHARYLQVALAGQSGPRTLHDQGFGAGSSYVRRSSHAKARVIEAITLDELLDRSGFETVDLLKMDIEGAEQEVFESVSTEALHRIRAAIIECHPFAGTDIAFLKRRLTEAGMVVQQEPYLLIATRSPSHSAEVNGQ
jgi:FkbM family methyltransferase